jgi:beta-lactamase superfamily II metal-dependent hydrolase
VYLRDIANPDKKVKQVLWGDYLKVVAEQDAFFRIQWGAVQYWVPKEDTTPERPLEVIFLDVGQGDGCLLVTPGPESQERIVVIDAGDGDNMVRYLNWRFGKFRKHIRFHAAVITHSDQDHYRGFQALFEQEHLHFDNVYHNGIAERAGAEMLGPSDPTRRFLVDLPATDADIRALYANPAVRGTKLYAKLLHTALQSGRVGNVQMLSTATGTQEDGRSWMPGFNPASGSPCSIEVLGPVAEPGFDGKPRLRWFGSTVGSRGRDVGKTKNGHSVLLRLQYRGFTLLFGGDLNAPAEHFLLSHYGGIPQGMPLSDAVPAARKRLRSDVMKSCHHGAADVTDEFLQAVQPFAFVVSSGDQENYVHPRPDLLGRLGRFGRGPAPLILCTETLRSTRERENPELLKRLRRLDQLIEAAVAQGQDAAAQRTERAKLQDQLAARNVEVYGAINVRTDGQRLVVAFRMELPRQAQYWQTYWYERAGDDFRLAPS